MTRRLDVDTMKHLARWCDRQFEYCHPQEVFNGMMNFLESLESHELDGYLNHSWWHAYDVATQLNYIGGGQQ